MGLAIGGANRLHGWSGELGMQAFPHRLVSSTITVSVARDLKYGTGDWRRKSAARVVGRARHAGVPTQTRFVDDYSLRCQGFEIWDWRLAAQIGCTGGRES